MMRLSEQGGGQGRPPPSSGKGPAVELNAEGSILRRRRTAEPAQQDVPFLFFRHRAPTANWRDWGARWCADRKAIRRLGVAPAAAALGSEWTGGPVGACFDG